MKLLVIQNQVMEGIEDNLTHLNNLFSTISHQNFDFIILPEMFTTPYELQYFKKNAEGKNGQVLKFLKEIAIKFKSYVIGGTVPELDNNKIYNTSFILNRSGEMITQYRKIHLFSVTYPNGEVFKESDVLTPGNEIISFDTEFGKMGIMICFDIRFPVLAHLLQKQGVKAIFVPAAFNTFTGPMHWHTTFKARAIDNQLFMIGSSPSRNSIGNYEPFGHSLIVNPLGEIINELNENEGHIISDIDLKDIDKARESIPIVKNQIDLYKTKIS